MNFPARARRAAVRVLVAGVLAPSAKAPAQPPPAPSDPATPAHAALEAKCAQCHGPQLRRPKGHFGLVTDLPRLAADPRYVAPGHPADSLLWQQIDTGEMPPDDAKAGPLTEPERTAIYNWILSAPQSTPPPAGAPETAAATRPAPGIANGVERPAAPTPWMRALEYAGRFHIMVIHFPIALLLTAAAAELWHLLRRTPGALTTARALLAVGAVFAVLSAGLGWLNALDWAGGAPQTLFFHRWIGTAAGVLSPLALLLSERDARRNLRRPLTRTAVFLVALLAGLAGHFGGLLAYGTSYFVP